MTAADVRAVLLRELHRIAPEVRPETLDPRLPLRDQVDIDSMDFLNFLIAARRELGVDVPEADYGRLRTLDACVEYFTSRRPHAEPAAHPDRK
ncbi:MAG TPA: acyl carrier protein [Gemmatimonadaceae bacterium]|nr:acyl carrier protein [Gemmatimonadaceae bacterium]